ncbi:MAG: K(+)-transporting ATPase subunit F [Bdellovibrionaceae bacterium]|nr:K(+)-transporting ATPase subunit F [Pseudobdellovibrionaceae bacterium]
MEEFMDFIVAGLIGCAVLVYLTYALFNPEKF